MSELVNADVLRGGVRWKLLSGVCTLALLASVCGFEPAKAEASDHPTVWIELGGQLEHMSQAQDPFAPAFLFEQQPLPPSPFLPRNNPASVPVPGPSAPFDRSQPLAAQKPPENSFGGEGRISFAPEGTDWTFSASLRYGRSNGARHVAQQTPGRPPFFLLEANATPIVPPLVRLADADASYTESHAIVDFQAGKDVGLGLFGRSATSTLNAGVRFAQFTSKSNANVTALPNMQVYHAHFTSVFFGPGNKYTTRFQSYLVRAHSERSFHGIGPSLSLNVSSPLFGNEDDGEFALDWGVNGALLFGRQKAAVEDGTYAYSHYQSAVPVNAPKQTTRYRNVVLQGRSHSVTVPNVGVFAGLSAHYPNAKVSFGYRADFFFGAMDAGVDTRHSEDMNFHGPFAKISIGFGG